MWISEFPLSLPQVAIASRRRSETGVPAAPLLLPRAMRPARASIVNPTVENAGKGAARRVLMLDLHAGHLPDEGVGLLAASLRAAGHEVSISRIAGAKASARRGGALRDLARRPIAAIRRQADAALAWAGQRMAPDARPAQGAALSARRNLVPDLLLVSASLAHYDAVAAIAASAARANVPLLLDASTGTAGPEAWRDISGLIGVIGPGGALEVQARVEKVGGVRLAADPTSGGDSLFALCETAQLALSGAAEAVPDYSDFAWAGHRVAPVRAAGRAGGRSIEALLCEMNEQSRRLETTNFLFLDESLNADADRLRTIGARIQGWLQGAEWAGRVEVDLRRRNGLSRADLRAGVAGGLRRLAVTLPSGSAAELLRQGGHTTVEALADFLAQAEEAGIIIHADMPVPGPATTAADLEATLAFLAAQAHRIHRLRFTGGVPDARLAVLAAGINATPALRAGRQFAEVL